jgi:RNA polymerase sigma-70 factor (ECF subfamily)
MLRSETHAEDTTQEVFVLAWNKRGSIRIVDQSILPWLLTSAQNLALNRLKKSRRESAHLSSQTSAELDVRAVDAESPGLIQMLGEAIDFAVGELSDMDQILYYLCIDEGLSYAEAASALGTTHGGVRNRLSRVRRLLQIRLAPQKEGIS